MAQKTTTRTTQQQALDPRTQQYVDQARGMLSGAAGGIMGAPAGAYALGPETQSIQALAAPFMDPYLGQVIGGVEGQFDRARAQANLGVNQAATQAGAFGGSRHGVMQGTRLAELDAAQAQQIGGLLSQGWQNAVSQGLAWNDYNRQAELAQRMEPILRAQAAGGLLNIGFGAPYGQTATTTNTQQGSTMGGIIGAGLALGSRFIDPTGGAASAAVPSVLDRSPGYNFTGYPLLGQGDFGRAAMMGR